MKLIEYEGKKVRIIDTEKRVWEGKVTDYIFPEDNVPKEVESIVIDCERGRYIGDPIEFTEADIKFIEVI